MCRSIWSGGQFSGVPHDWSGVSRLVRREVWRAPPHNSAWYSQVVLLSLNVLRWTHFVPMSFLRLMLVGSVLLFNIASFSVMQRSQHRIPGLYVTHFLMMSHFIFGLGSIFLSQMYWDRVVEFFLAGVLKEWTCWVYLVLNFPCVIPM